jgi:hypothetical protein
VRFQAPEVVQHCIRSHNSGPLPPIFARRERHPRVTACSARKRRREGHAKRSQSPFWGPQKPFRALAAPPVKKHGYTSALIETKDSHLPKALSSYGNGTDRFGDREG